MNNGTYLNHQKLWQLIKFRNYKEEKKYLKPAAESSRVYKSCSKVVKLR